MINHFLKGVDFKNARLTRSLRVWFEYLCWCIQSWMDTHKPYLPVKMRAWLLAKFPPERWHSGRTYYYRLRNGAKASEISKFKPLPWPICPSAFGPFVGPWSRVERWFRNRTGGRSHRCEFTDKTDGALYGGTEGGFMDKLFDQFIENIS
jgi:hypothetical protein